MRRSVILLAVLWMALDLRRGRDTANALFGNEASVLVGDFVYSRAFQVR